MKDLLYKIAISGSVKMASAIIAFFLTVVVARTLGADEAGLFLLVVSLLASLSVFFRLGLDGVILKVVGAEGLSDKAQAQLRTGLCWIMLVSLPMALGISLSAEWWAVSLFDKPAFSPVLRWAVWALPCMSMFMLLAMGFIGLHQVVLGTLFQNLGLATVFLLLLGAYHYWWPESLSAQLAAQLYMLAAVAVGLLAVTLWVINPQVSLFCRTSVKSPKLWAASSNLWVANSMSLAVIWSGVLVGGAYLPTAELAHLSAAQRTSNLTSFVLMVVNVVVAPRYARLWAEDNQDQVRSLARWSTRCMIVLVLPVIAVMMMLPSYIMSIFGEGFEQGAILLMIMSAGQFVNVATGSVAYLLQMSGHERDFRRVTLFAGPLAIIAAVAFTAQWGAVGAASATALGLSVQNLGALWMVKKRLGFWPIG
ncbi:oligosaccharide flippase family protein [Aestuariicella hydrocarbonica]|uniref:Oligosaccharide flippase family protein n=1 Tax=Pseudomaricurvus hydrocarbonicus TaxID=1470433 RepID=A0A9E5MQI4_9GAMM|nr:oligosaccharide flippase family protein [Aestuariicella hydrocarbonica]NHO68483.1 oligosaccharide flippase family protein [Aestuariicella hydrocarbonica]